MLASFVDVLSAECEVDFLNNMFVLCLGEVMEVLGRMVVYVFVVEVVGRFSNNL